MTISVSFWACVERGKAEAAGFQGTRPIVGIWEDLPKPHTAAIMRETGMPNVSADMEICNGSAAEASQSGKPTELDPRGPP